MKTYEHELAHLYEHRKNVFRFGSVSLFQSLITASVIIAVQIRGLTAGRSGRCRRR